MIMNDGRIYRNTLGMARSNDPSEVRKKPQKDKKGLQARGM
ncbi:hypothetical protein [Paraburkholderia atlantica]|nr:hypothetical protein [Paraburkholderia atlantica]